ncbi:hypothetical protein NHQ30_004017 [Ciborinia camelliae]|nr:hypothetical protein NHQ30_004017 [Ciborinia camelliae]
MDSTSLIEERWGISTICFLLERLPREIRDKIWRYILLKPVTISPTGRYIYRQPYRMGGRYNYSYYTDTSHNKFAYHWHQYPDHGKNHCNVPYISNEYPMMRFISWTTKPTMEQQKMIQIGTLGPSGNIDTDDVEKEATILTDSEDMVQCNVHYRKNYGAQIINRAKIPLVPFGWDSVNIMQTCQQIEHECALILYGENSYAFHINYIEFQELKEMPLDIPGLISDNGVAISNGQLRGAIEKLFCWKCRHPKFFCKDPLIRFMRIIGPRNSSFLRDIKIDGYFRVSYHPVDDQDNKHVGFRELLPIYTAILRGVCTDFRKLTIHNKDEQPHYKNSFWDVSFGDPQLESAEDLVDEIVRGVVEGLPTLRELQLGDYIKVPGREYKYADTWGKSLRWMSFVERRHQSQILQTNDEDKGHNGALTEATRGIFGSVKERMDASLHVTVGGRHSRTRWKVKCGLMDVEKVAESEVEVKDKDTTANGLEDISSLVAETEER